MQITIGKKDIGWSYIGTIFSMLGNFLILPFLVVFLDEECLGLWYVYLAVGNLVMLFEFGFNPTFARNFAFCWSGAKKLTREGCNRDESNDAINPELLAHLLAACRMVYRRITIIAFVVLATLGTLYVSSVTAGMDFLMVSLSWIIFSFAVLFNLYYLYYSAMIRGMGLVAVENQIKVIARLSQLFITIFLLFIGMGILGAAIGFLANAVVYRIMGYIKFWRDKRIVLLRVRCIPINKTQRNDIYKTISFNAYKDGSVQIANYASTQSSSLICSSFFGLAQAGSFSIALQFATAIGNLALAFMNSYRPMLQSGYQLGNKKLVKSIFSKCILAYVTIFPILFIAVLIVAYPLLSFFKPGSSFDPLVYTGVCIYLFAFDWCALFSAMLCNMNIIPYAKAYVITAAVGIMASLFLVGIVHMDVWGLILGIAIPQCAYNVWKWPREATKRLETTPFKLLKFGLINYLKINLGCKDVD